MKTLDLAVRAIERSRSTDPATIARAVLRALPSQVVIGSSGCGGETVVAAFTDVPMDCLVTAVNRVFSDSDGFFPILETVPLLRRPEDWDDLPLDFWDNMFLDMTASRLNFKQIILLARFYEAMTGRDAEKIDADPELDGLERSARA